MAEGGIPGAVPSITPQGTPAEPPRPKIAVTDPTNQPMAETVPSVVDEEPIKKSGLENVEGSKPKAPVEAKSSSEAPPKKQRRAKLKAKDSSDKVIG